MLAELFGHVQRPVVAMVGVFDPFLDGHENIIRQLCQHASSRRESSLVVILTPRPTALDQGSKAWPMFHDDGYRITAALRCGVEAVLRVRLSKPDLTAGVAELLNTINAYVKLSELWLGHNQSLGRGENGSASRIDTLSVERGFAVRRLPRQQSSESSVALQCLRVGAIAQAVCKTKRYPIVSQSGSGLWDLGWPPGIYQAVPTSIYGELQAKPVYSINLSVDANRLCSFRWPNFAVSALAFIRGPADPS
jgi:FAD synthase